MAFLHVELAEKFLKNTLSIFKTTLQHAGTDAKADAQQLLEAIKNEAEAQLAKLAPSLENKLEQSASELLQDHQRAPKAETATSIRAPVDTSFFDNGSDEGEQTEEGEGDSSDSSDSSGSSGTGLRLVGPDASAEAAGGDSVGEPEGDFVGGEADSSKPVDPSTNPASSVLPAGNDPKLLKEQADANAAAPARTPTEQPVAPEGSPSDFHGTAMPSSGLQSLAASQAAAPGSLGEQSQGDGESTPMATSDKVTSGQEPEAADTTASAQNAKGVGDSIGSAADEVGPDQKQIGGSLPTGDSVPLGGNSSVAKAEGEESASEPVGDSAKVAGTVGQAADLDAARAGNIQGSADTPASPASPEAGTSGTPPSGNSSSQPSAEDAEKKSDPSEE